MKYVISLGGTEFVRTVAWFTETLPLVTLSTNNINKAKLFDDISSEKIFQDYYPDAKFIVKEGK